MPESIKQDEPGVSPNNHLADLIRVKWNHLTIVKIERVNNPPGWRVVFEEQQDA